MHTTVSEESPQIRKDSAILLNDHYNSSRTSLLTFHFEPHPFASTLLRFQNCSIKHASIDGKDLYVFDDFFLSNEGKEVRDFSRTAPFSRNSYGSPEAIEKGEKPARSMNGKERWQFFSRPPPAINELYKLLALFAHQLNVDVSTLPWELCDQSLNGSPSVIANFLEEASHESMELGKHQDCNPEKGIAFGIPILYPNNLKNRNFNKAGTPDVQQRSNVEAGHVRDTWPMEAAASCLSMYAQEKNYFPSHFINGEEGKPWLVSMMLYATEENYLPEYCMGTTFYKNDGKRVLQTNCLNMRLVLFEGDIFHTIEKSNIPSDIKTWRVSYVFKLIFNPRNKDQNVKEDFAQKLFQMKVERVEFGEQARI